MMTKKTIVSAFALALTVAPAMAGGLLTNTNQNAAFLRNFAQEGTITLTSIYANPAGGAFLSNGWHLSLNSQTAIQSRDIQTTFGPFAYNRNNPNTTHEFKGDAKAPVIPSFTASWNHGKWSVSAHGSLVGGGGKAQFNEGLGSFEAAYSGMMPAMVPPAVRQGIVSTMVTAGYPQAQAEAYAAARDVKYTGYSLNSFMKGRSYYFGLQVGGTYKILDNLAAYVGLRGIYATCNYAGNVSPTAFVTIDGVERTEHLGNYGIALDCDQTGFGIAPIIGVNWEINKHWNVSAKYEVSTRIKLKNSTNIEINPIVEAQATGVLGQFADGKKVRDDMPGLLAIGAQYSPIEKVRFSAAFHEYFDKAATKDGFKNDGTKINKNDNIERNTWELMAGAEYDCCKLITVSASWQRTKYSLGDAYMSDLSFNNSNNSLGLGLRIHPSKYFNIDLGYMHTFYQDKTVTTNTAAGPKTDVYSRKNNVFGVGINFAL